ncbi:MAG: phage terminase large subunit [Ignavibacteriales bacterium]|nr:phage terminase large subunit [Ignavibacteriales bacterium]
MEAKIEISYHSCQRQIFESDARFKVIAKGRRFGLTRGMANYVIEQMLQGVSPVLWIDTVYGNIERYVERYFKPVLAGLPKSAWNFRSNRNDLKILNAVCDFRSADRPENIEGFGYALIIINEAGIILKNRSLWEESIRPMILDHKAKVIIGGTPKGKVVKRTRETHLFYELFERGLQGGEAATVSHWKSFNYSTYDNPLLDPLEIDEMVKEISPALREQEVNGKFVELNQEGIIRREWFRFYQIGPDYKPKGNIIQSWDTAFKKNAENDYSVCTTWLSGENGYYLLDMWKGRVEFPELKRKVVELYERYKPQTVLIEDKASGQSLIQELQRGTRIPIKAVKVDKDKVARVHSITPLIEAGRVYLPEGHGFTEELIRECEDFPAGQFDDSVDSMSQALEYLKAKDYCGNTLTKSGGRRKHNRKTRHGYLPKKSVVEEAKRLLLEQSRKFPIR